jgi:transposase-like protein
MQKEAWERAIDEGRPWTDAEAARALAASEASGMTTAEFARTHNLTAGKLYWWRKRLRRGGAQPARLLPVKVVAAGAGEAPRSRVVLTDGRWRLEIDGMPAEWVATLLLLVRQGAG